MPPELFTDMDLYGYEQVGLDEAIAATEAEQRAAAVAEQEQAARDAESIRAMFTATEDTDADARWVAGLGAAAVEPVADQRTTEATAVDDDQAVEQREFAVLNTARGDIRVHAATCGDVARDRKRYGTHPVIVRSADKHAIVAEFMSDFVEEGEAVEDLDGDFVWVSCCGDLPWEAADEEDSAPEVDLDALQMTPMVRALVVDLDSRRWHYQTRKGALAKGLTTDIDASGLTEFGACVRAALLAK